MMNRKALHVTKSTIVAPSLLAIAVTTAIYTSANATSSSTSTTETLGVEHQLICVELGLTPEALAALGVQGHQVTSLFNEIDEQSGLIASIRSLQAQHQDALSSLKSVQRSIRHAETQVDEAQLQAEINQLESAVAASNQSIKQTQSQLRSIILPTGIQVQDVNHIYEPIGSAALVPVEFRFAELREEDYVEIIAALAQEQRAQANNEQPDSDTQLTLSRYRNLPEVQQARSNLLYNLDAVRGAFSN